MCSKKDINTILDQLQRCNDHEQKLRILQQFDTCSTCTKIQHGVDTDVTRCGCEEFQRAELFNLIEHLRQCVDSFNIIEDLRHLITKKSSDK